MVSFINKATYAQLFLVAASMCLLALVILSPENPSLARGLQEEDDRDLKKSWLMEHTEQNNFNVKNPHEEWCPDARCSNSPMCTPCDRRFLFIVATGRSGSTTLLDMFDSLPGVRIAGENWGELNIAADLASNLQKGWFQNNVNNRGPFRHNPIHEQSMACFHQHLVHALNPPSRWMQHFEDEPVGKYDSSTILGMKTIRIQDKDWTPKEAAAYFKENFPCSRFIVNIRENSEAQAISMMRFFHGTNMTETYEIVERANKFLKDFTNELGKNTAVLIDLDMWKSSVSPLNRIITWLGFRGCKFADVIHENHNDFELNDEQLDLGDDCEYPFL